MHIIIPMSGIGKRFIDQGYQVPKPLIVIDGKPIIEHVVNLFPGETQFTFICNEQHLSTTPMRSILEGLSANANIIAIKPHKKGPVYAVAQLAATTDLIDDNEEVIVNYCDFGTYWDYQDFLDHTRSRDADGAVPAYKGFHPHMLGKTNYAFMRDQQQWMSAIQEKKPFTDNRMDEYASNGTYYFKHGAYIKKFFNALMAADINVNGEYYVSLIYNLMVEAGLKVSIYQIQHMLQWGTPEDVAQYNAWSDYFNRIMQPQNDVTALTESINLIPLAGRGSRFSERGYQQPKPLIDVSGKPMIIQAAASLPSANAHRFVCLQQHLDAYPLSQTLQQYYPDASIIALDRVTEGQAMTCDLGLDGVDDDAPLLIAACDNAMVYDHAQYQRLLADHQVDAIVWTFRNHPGASQNPQMYGWVKTESDRAVDVSVKVPISATPEKDHAIVGTFFFRKTRYFREALAKMRDDNIRVNNEFYVDSMVGILAAAGYRVQVFEVDHYICWGTPDDYETFRYWQSYFHKDTNHGYRIEHDPSVNADRVQALTAEFYDFKQEYR